MGKKILVIDDDPTGGMLMESRLTRAGYEVVRAMNGQHGLTLLKAAAPDLVILDIEMPEMNGYTFMTELRKEDAFADMPVIVLTAHNENRAIFQRKGIKEYLVKPVNFEMLFAKMAELLPEG